jgi:hypothetical protein
MDSKHFEILLEKYWKCETSLEEEKELRDYFQGRDIPQNMNDTAELFRYFEAQQKQLVIEPAFDEEVKRKITSHRPQGKVVKMMYNYARIAAGLIVVVAATYFVRQEVRKSYPPEVADTYSDPKLAFEETKKALMMISKGFGKAQREANKIKMFNEAEMKINKKEEEKPKTVTI